MAQVRHDLKTPNQKTTVEHVQDLLAEMAQLEALNKKLNSDVIASSVNKYVSAAQTNSQGLTLSVIQVQDMDATNAKELVEKVRDQVDLVVLCNLKEVSVSFVVGCSDTAIKEGYKAGDLAKLLAVATGGNGGGKPQFAQAGGKNPEALADALRELEVKVGF